MEHIKHVYLSAREEQIFQEWLDNNGLREFYYQFDNDDYYLTTQSPKGMVNPKENVPNE